MFSKICIWGFIAVAAFMAGCTTRQTGGPTVQSGAVIVESENARAAIVFSDSDRRRIKEYYRSGYKDKTKKLPPGLAKKNELPPGLRKHIEKHGQLPPGLEGRRLPDDLEMALQPLPAGYVRLQVGGDVLLMNEESRYVLDVVWDVN